MGHPVLDDDDLGEENYNSDNYSDNESYKDYNFKEEGKENSPEQENQPEPINISKVCQVCSDIAQTDKTGKLRYSWKRILCSKCHTFWSDVLHSSKLETVT